MGAQRWAREDLNFGGKHLHRGSHVVIALSAANRDGERFADPERLNITRQENHHLAFSRGIHYCLGAHLARLECQVAINTLLNRLPRLRSNAELRSLTWRAGPLIVGLNELPVAF